LKRLEDGRRRFFEPGLDERSRLVALRDSFDSISAQRGPAHSKTLIKEGRDLIGLSNFIKIADTLTSIDGGRSQDTQKKGEAAGQLAQSLEEIKRLCQVSPPGQSALNLQQMLGGRQPLNELIGSLQSRDPNQRDEAIRTLVQATSRNGRYGPEAAWWHDNLLTGAVKERRENQNGGDSAELPLSTARLFTSPLPRDGQPVHIELQLNQQFEALRAAQAQSRRAMSLDESNQFLYNFGNGKTSKPETLEQRMMTVSQFLLNDAHGILNTPLGAGSQYSSSLVQNLTPFLRPENRELRLPVPGASILDAGRSPYGSLIDALNPQLGHLSVRGREELKAPSWLAAGEGVRDLSSASNILEATRVVDRLGQLAHSGDPHARTALAATLVSLTTGADGVALMRSRTQGQEPVFVPDLSRLKDSDRDSLKAFVMSQLNRDISTYVFRDFRLAGTPRQSDATILRPQSDVLPREAITAIAIAYGSGLASNATAEERTSMESILRSQANTEGGAYALWYALSAPEAPRNDAMEQMLVSGLTGKRGDYFLDKLIPSAMKGNEDAIRILGKSIGQDGLESGKTDRVFEALKQAVRNGQGEAVVKALLDEFANYGDNGSLLNCLGAIAQDGHISKENSATITDLLRRQVASGDAETHSSAVRGFMRLSSTWTDADLRLIADNVSETTVLGLKDVISSTNPERAKQLSHLLEENLRSGTYTDVQRQSAAVTALGVMADYAPASAAAAIKDAVSAERFASVKGADALTMAGVHTLMRIAGSRSAASDFALDALKQPGFRNTASLKLDQQSVRAELADYVTGRITRAEMSAAAKAATFNSGFPQSLHSLMREQGVGANNVDVLVESARNNFDDNTIRSVMNRVEIYNSLPPDIRSRILGSESPANIDFAPRTEVGGNPPSTSNEFPDRIDMLGVFGQMAGGTLESGPNGLLLEPLENRVREFRDAVAAQRREVSSEYRTNEDSVQTSLQSLTDHTTTGVSTWGHTKSMFGSPVLSDFINVQDEKLFWYNHELTDRRLLDGDLRKLNNNHELFSISADFTEYRRLRNEGRESEADRLAITMLKDHGPSLAAMAPEIWKDLGMACTPSGELLLGTADGETIWQRLHRQDLAGSSDVPALVVGQPGGIAYGIKELNVDLKESKVDTPVRQQLALLAIDTDPTIAQFRESAMTLQQTLPDLDKLLRAGLEGTRGREYVKDVRAKVGVLQQEIERMNTEDGQGGTPLSRARESLKQLKDSLDTVDPEAQAAINERIAAMEMMIQVFDRDSQIGLNIKLLSEKVNSTDFNESGFITWLRGDGIKTIGAVAAAVAAAAAVGSALATFGATTPLAVAAVTLAVAAAATVGGIVGYELTAEALYHMGSGERTGAQIFHACRGGLVDGEDGNARAARYGEVWADYGWQFVQGLGISLATMGLGAGLGKGVSSIAGKVLSRTATAETQAMARIGARAAQVEAAAAKAGGQELKKRWMARFGEAFKSEIKDEFGDEVKEKAADIGIEHFAGDANPTLSVFASALLASKKGLSGIDLHPRRGGVMEMSFDPGTNAIDSMSKLHDQMVSDGMRVDWNGRADSAMMVTTPEGFKIDVRPEGAAIQTGSARLASEDSLAKLSTGGIDAPHTAVDIKAARLATLETNLERPGVEFSSDERSAMNAEIESLRAEIVTDFKNEAVDHLARTTGLSMQDAKTIVAGLNIQVKPYAVSATSAGAFNNADGSLTIYAGGYMPSAARPQNTFVHEFAHALDAAKYSALHSANPTAFVDSLVDDVLANSFSGKTGIWDKPGARSAGDMIYTRLKVGEGGLSEADVNFSRQMLGDYLRQHSSQGQLPETPTQEALAAWIKDKGGKFPDSKQESVLLREMVREISHANTVMTESRLGTAAMNSPAIQNMVQAFAEVQGADPVRLKHAMRGISDATTALADGSHYDFGSRYENRANRFQARAMIEATQNSMPGLTSELFALTAGNPEFADLNAELGSLLSSTGDGSTRRAGVRQIEFFSSAHGQAELARLKSNDATKGIAERISVNAEARQSALTTQRFLTALDMLPAQKAQLDSAADETSRNRAQQSLDSTLESLFTNAKVEDLPKLVNYLETNGLASINQIRHALSGIGAELPPSIDVPQNLPKMAGQWRSTLDSLSSVDATGAMGRCRQSNTQALIAAGVESAVDDWTPSREKFDNLRMAQDRAEHAAKQEDAWKALGPDAAAQTDYWNGFKREMETAAAKISQELAPEISTRAEALKSSLNRTLAASNLPPTNITVVSTGSSTINGANTPPARYNPETGKIEVSPELLLTANPEQISAAVRAEYEKSLAHQFAVAAAGNQNLPQVERDAAARVNDTFAQQASADAEVEQLAKRAEMLADNQRLLLSEGGVRTLLGRMSANSANIESILVVAPPAELNNLLAKFRQARKADGSLDSKKWSMDSDQEVSRLLFPAVYRANVQARADLQIARDRPATAGEVAYDRAGLDSQFVDAIAATDFSPDYGTQMDQRIGLAIDHSWAIPDRASLSAIYDFAGPNGIVEVGAGKGLWAGALRRMGADVAAYDINANNVDNNIYHRGESVSKVEQGGIEKAGDHPNKTLLLSWPTPGEPMAADALKAYSDAGGTKLAFIGERPTPGSELYNTGDKQFHQTLNSDWLLTGVVDMPHVPDGTNLSTSKLYLYERRISAPDLVKASKLPDAAPNTSEILDRATAGGDLLPKHRAVYEKAVQDGILKPAQLEQVFSEMSSLNREVVVFPLLSSGKLNETGASTLASLRNSQLNVLSEMNAQHLNSLVALMNNPNIARSDLGALLSRPADQRAVFSNLLFEGKPLPKPEVSSKILKLSPQTAADLKTMIDQSPTQRQAVLDFVQNKGLGEISFTALLSTRNDLSPEKAAVILNSTVRNADIAHDATRKAAADGDLALVAEALRSFDSTNAGKLLDSIASGNLTTKEVARFQTAAQKGLIGNSNVSMSDVLAADSRRRNALSAMLEQNAVSSSENRLGPEDVDRIFRNGNRIATAVDSGVTSYLELHSLMIGTPGDAIAAEIILNQGSAATTLSRPTIEGLIASSRDGSISVSDFESIRVALTDGTMSESALKGILSQPAAVRSQLTQQFGQLWQLREATHDSALQQPLVTRTKTFIESENKKFIEQFVNELASHSGNPNTLNMAADRISGFQRTSLSQLEPALVRTSPMVLRDAIGGASAEVRAFADAMARGDLSEAIRLGMADITGLSNEFTTVKIAFDDLNNPERVAAVIEKMDKIGFARGYEGRGESGSIADLARPVVTLPNGKPVDLSGPTIKLAEGDPTAQDQRFIELLENNPTVRVLRGRVALTAYEERLIHSHQGVGGAQSSLVKDMFTQSEEYTAMQNHYRNRSAKMQEAMREIDVAARLVESGMSLTEVRELMGSRHLHAERDFFYNWFARSHPERVNPEVATRATTRPELLKESKLPRNSASVGNPAGGSDADADLTKRIEQAAPGLQRSLNQLVKAAGGDSNNLAVIDHILKMGPESLPQGLRDYMDPKLIKIMKGDIFPHIRSKLGLESGAAERTRPQDEDGRTKRIPPPENVRSFETAPEIDFAASKRKMRESGANIENSVDMLSVLSDYQYKKSGRRGAEYADALEQTEFFRQFKDSIRDAQVVGEGNESVVMKVKGPFVLGEGNSQISVDEMVVKLTKPLRGEWHEDWGSWEKRPWDALTISHEEVDGIDVYVQEAAQTDIAPEHEELFRKALKAYNKAHTADGDDRYVLWDGDDRGGAGKQFGYSSLSARPDIDAGSVWVEVNGQPRRVVLLDHWAVKPYGEDGKAEFE
jgi:hypothetical protein